MGKIRDLIRSTSNNSDDYNKKYVKIKFISDSNLTLEKTELYNLIKVLKSASHEISKYYMQVFYSMNICINIKT